MLHKRCFIRLLYAGVVYLFGLVLSRCNLHPGVAQQMSGRREHWNAEMPLPSEAHEPNSMSTGPNGRPLRYLQGRDCAVRRGLDGACTVEETATL